MHSLCGRALSFLFVLILGLLLISKLLPPAVAALVTSFYQISEAITSFLKNTLWVVGIAVLIALALRLAFFLKNLILNWVRMRNEHLNLEQLDGTGLGAPISASQHMTFDPMLFREDQEDDDQFVFDDINDWDILENPGPPEEEDEENFETVTDEEYRDDDAA